MDPFFLLGLEEGATDDEVRTRYYQLVERFPPEREPEMFSRIAEAYELLRTPKGRLNARLFYFDRQGDALCEEPPPRLPAKRRRLSRDELRALVAGSDPPPQGNKR